MEVTTIIGIVVAVIIILVGLRMVLRKPNDAAPSLESELHINEDCKQPVIPRHVRDQLRTDRESQEQVRVEPNLTALDSVEVIDEKQQKIEDVTAESNTVQSTEHVAITQQIEKTETVASTESATESVKALDVQTEPTTQTTDSAKAVVSQDKEEAFQFNSNVETTEIKEFDEESSILDVHLNEQQKYDDESVLSTAETIIALNVYPNPRKALSGDKTLKMLLKYGLRFGELSCFHRYENPEEESHLLFSVLRVTDNGPDGFDLETLSTEQVQGLAFFLALPHSDVQKGFDTMVSIAGLIAREIDGTVYDENNLEFTPQLKEHWRHKAIDYRSGHDA
ncbi:MULTISPECIES: cell division protein ZipA C-terminal FtsZ-binding domain-containing protein [Acinetobacter]|uniref:cell division protein ZipA C-terminal FtsZ-binding domain-containing protein n=1 Tax=Acinetobacter TaxID=469 RepID=UPI000CFE6EA6|nr:cell division protein ZipA C-terminal FtsZ-binding domain-containing protein [Acinetobacter sp. MYb10]QLD62844.1 cell division protein ZipA [Acinetobacter sp. MYb10]